MAPRKKLGQLLIEGGLIDEIQLSSAMGHQRNWGGKLGSTLVELGFITEDDIARVLEEQLRQHCVSDREMAPQPGVLDLVSAADAARYEIFPLRLDGSVLTLAMANPFDLAVVDELGFRVGKRIKPVLAVESTIKRAIKRFYHGEDTGRDYRAQIKPRDASGPMEVVHRAERHEPGPSGPAPDTGKVEPSADLIAKALAFLLIEKGIIKRDELIDKMKAIKDNNK